MHGAEDVIGTAGSEDLFVPRVVANKRKLSKQDRQQRGNQQLPPAVAEEGERDPGAGEHDQVAGDLQGVVAVARRISPAARTSFSNAAYPPLACLTNGLAGLLIGGTFSSSWLVLHRSEYVALGPCRQRSPARWWEVGWPGG